MGRGKGLGWFTKVLSSGMPSSIDKWSEISLIDCAFLRERLVCFLILQFSFVSVGLLLSTISQSPSNASPF